MILNIRSWCYHCPHTSQICRVVSLEPLGYFIQIKGLEGYSLSPIQA